MSQLLDNAKCKEFNPPPLPTHTHTHTHIHAHTSIKELTSTSTNVLTSTRGLTSMKELTNTSTKESTSMISTPHSRWSLSRIFQTGLLHNIRFVLVTLTCYSLFFSFALPCKCSFPLIPCSLTCYSLFFSFAWPSEYYTFPLPLPAIPSSASLCRVSIYSLLFLLSSPAIPFSSASPCQGMSQQLLVRVTK